MFKVLRPIRTIVLIVVFMFLAVVASVNYSPNQEKKEEMQKSFAWQAGDKIVSTVVSGFNFVSSLTLNPKEAEEGEQEKNGLNEEQQEDGKLNFFEDLWQDFNAKVSNISFDNFFSKFNKENLNLEIEKDINKIEGELIEDDKKIVDEERVD